jgi:hypothetical protein
MLREVRTPVSASLQFDDGRISLLVGRYVGEDYRRLGSCPLNRTSVDLGVEPTANSAVVGISREV